MLASDPGEDNNVYNDSDAAVMMTKMAGLPDVRLFRILALVSLFCGFIHLCFSLLLTRRCCPVYESADEDEAAALLPHSGDEDEQKQGVTTKIKRNRWMERDCYKRKEDGIYKKNNFMSKGRTSLMFLLI